MLELLIATGNKGKIAEIGQLLDGQAFVVKGLSDFPAIVEVEETGSTFAENAILKARGYGLQAGILSLADDSGLEIEALNNGPGIFSARYGGENTNYQEKIRLVLAELERTGDEKRRARFVCAMALAGPNGKIIHISEGACHGTIASQPRGTGGFGYDPVFVPDGFSGTFGELAEGVKQQISHRKRAIDGIMPFLLDFKGV
jgi:XTP/dITP diphosphohydrolase